MVNEKIEYFGFKPDTAIPPGETIKETIEFLGMTQTELAARMGRPLKTINEIIKGKTMITPETAIQLERVLGISADYILRLEQFYRKTLARLKEERRSGPWPLWKLWGIRTLPVSLLLIAALTVTALFFLPAPQEELSQSGILLRNQNPFEESLPLLAEEGVENPNMVLIFTSLSETSSSRRYIP